jgi:hypothetical protein
MAAEALAMTASIPVTRERAKTRRKGTPRHNGKRPRKCRACKRPFIPKRADARTCSNKCRQALHRRNHSFRRWRVLPPEGQGECDYDPELEPAFHDDTPDQFRRSAADAQLREATRLAEEFALLQRGTEPHEITARCRRVLPRVRAVIRAWRQLLAKLRSAGRPPSESSKRIAQANRQNESSKRIDLASARRAR